MLAGTDWYIVRGGRITEVRAYLYLPAQSPFDQDSQLTGFPYVQRGYLNEVGTTGS